MARNSDGRVERDRLNQRVAFYPDTPAFFMEPGKALAISLTVLKCVAQFATRYQCWPVGFPDKMAEGSLTGTQASREHVIDIEVERVINWLNANGRAGSLHVGFTLFDQDIRILNQPEGPPAQLNLLREQFAVVSQCWAEKGLARSLYFPQDSVVSVVEPMRFRGGVVRVERQYGPEQRGRKLATSEDLVVPTEEERRAAFWVACRAFYAALELRIAELTEPGDRADLERVRRLEGLRDQVMDELSGKSRER
jgi:hypothetical protein